MPLLVVLNGPNLNLLGEREPEIYGNQTLADCDALACSAAEELGWNCETAQHNGEGALIDAIHDARERADALVINPGAFTHYSYAVADALASVTVPKVELHISNVHAREAWRRDSVISPVVTGVIAGFGTNGYAIAVRAVIEAAAAPQ